MSSPPGGVIIHGHRGWKETRGTGGVLAVQHFKDGEQVTVSEESRVVPQSGESPASVDSETSSWLQEWSCVHAPVGGVCACLCPPVCPHSLISSSDSFDSLGIC